MASSRLLVLHAECAASTASAAAKKAAEQAAAETLLGMLKS
jgi:hypothetical protein